MARKLVKTGRIENLIIRRNLDDIWIYFELGGMKFSGTLEFLRVRLDDGDFLRVFYEKVGMQNKILSLAVTAYKDEKNLNKLRAIVEQKIGTHAMFSLELFGGISLVAAAIYCFVFADGAYFHGILAGLGGIFALLDARNVLKWFRE